MSRVAKHPIKLPSGVEVRQDGAVLTIKGSKGSLTFRVHSGVEVSIEGGEVKVAPRDGVAGADMLAGTTRAVVNNMVSGVSKGFERKLELIGVGYRAQAAGNKVNLTLGYSHPIEYVAPEGITLESPSQTEILIKGVDRQKVGQVAAEIRAFRPPEPYKGKGVKYAKEQIQRKEAKKK